MPNLIEVQNKSKSDPSKPPYTTVVAADGRLGCDCRGWTVLKPNKARECTHITGRGGLIEKYGLTYERRGDYLYVTNLSQLGGANVTVTGSASGAFHSKKKSIVEQILNADAAKTERKAPAKPTKPAQIVHGIKIIDIDDTETLNPYVDPMLASQMPGLPDQKIETVLAALSNYKASEWAMEEKFDGHRVIVAVQDGKVTAWSRPRVGKEALSRTLPPHIVEAFSEFPNCTVDGEFIVPGGMSTDVVDLSRAGTEEFIVFDIVRLLGEDTTQCTYDERRGYLEEMFKRGGLDDSPVVKLAQSVKPSAAFVREIWARNGEGAIIKRRAARYQPGARSADFIKIKGLEHERMEVIGYKKGKLGACASVKVRNPKDNSETTVAAMGGGKELLDALTKNPNAYIGRVMIIEYQLRTPDGGYRHPRFDRWENE